MTAWIWAPLWKAGSVTFAGVDGRTNHLCLFLRPGPFPSLVPVPCLPCGPPHLSRPVSSPPRSAAAAPLLNVPAPFPCLYPSLPDKTFPSPLPGMSSVGVWSWTGYWRQQTGGGEVTASGRMAGNIPLETQHNTQVRQHKQPHSMLTDDETDDEGRVQQHPAALKQR